MRAWILAAALLAHLAPAVQAQSNFPDKPIRVIVTFPPGGSADAVVRMLVPRLNDSRGQQVGGDLDEIEAEVEQIGEGGDQQCLRQAGNPDEERVGATEDGNEELLDDLVLTDDDKFELFAHRGVGGPKFLDDCFVRCAEFRVGLGCRFSHGIFRDK